MTNILFLGNIGSGKSAVAVRETFKNADRIKTYSNIKFKGKFPVERTVQINSSMIIKKELQEVEGKKPKEVKVFNKEYWASIGEPINVVIDEAHIVLFNSRRAMSNNNIIANDFLAMIRRVVSEKSHGGGDLILISQLSRRIDIVAREMAHQIRYFIMHYRKSCVNCGAYWSENSEMPEKINYCPNCRSIRLKRSNFCCETFHFRNIDDFDVWKMYKEQILEHIQTINNIII